MKGIIKDIEYSLIMFNQLKHNKIKYSYEEIPKLLDSIEKIVMWISFLEEDLTINLDEFYKIDKLLEQYYRTEYLENHHPETIYEYEASKSTASYQFEIEYELSHGVAKKKNTYYVKWLERQNLQIKQLIKFNRYSQNSRNKLLKNISLESYNNKKVYSFLKKYFISKLDNLFSKLHLNFEFETLSIITTKYFDSSVALAMNKNSLKDKEQIKLMSNSGSTEDETKPKENEKLIKKQFKDFFYSDTKLEIIKSIQNNYKDEKGKKMAYLIYLLDKEFKIIKYTLDDKNCSRKHFVESLVNKEITMSGINKVFETHSTDLRNSKYYNDNAFINLKRELTDIIK